MTLIFDTNVLFASLNRDDRNHLPCLKLYESRSDTRIVPAPVLVELDHFIRRDLGRQVHATFLCDIIDGAFFIEPLMPSDYVRIRQVCSKYSDMDLGFVDASIVAIAERLNEPRIATLDHRHFRAIRPRHVDAFQLLPE